MPAERTQMSLESDAEVRDIEALRGSAPQQVDSQRVMSWMKSDDLEVQGAVFVLLRDSGATHPPQPAISETTIVSFFMDYLGRVLEEGSESLTRHGAGYEVVRWLLSSLGEKDFERTRSIVTWLGELYKASSSSTRNVIVNGALEHLFEDRRVRRLFQHWRSDPVLTVAYEEADGWRKGGGSSPLTGS
jgi:hypothetical protein